MTTHTRRTAAVAALVVALVAGMLTAPNAVAQRIITLTLVRHAQSEGNASGLIDTSTPGPPLTALGREQAETAAQKLAAGHTFDGIYASTMIRTQQTAQPLADLSSEPVTVLPGLREIEAGIYEGQPEALAGFTYYEAPTRWLQGDRTARIPGSIDGDEFDARFDEAVREIYDSEDTDPVAFSHAGAIMTWVAMNVDNPDLGLLSRHPLGNTGHAVVKGNPTGGWTLVDWDGINTE
ncbi:histidine phosphatase family protein [Mycolicibacterium smegmatis]|uniref:histidine phosphatase family protein n=1 Tax=Mycolicibacterium smegmatis TaxID=1772 RepID=UPI001EFAC22A|nr:histidine phosphatase family protein [Mycolicibacterium smegmatis]ULN35179.1 histidine phosphatase family protein [Mycolicibacterium smegmatis]